MKPSREIQIPRGLEWRHENKPRSIILRHFLEILGIFGGGNGTLDQKYGKRRLLEILPPQQARKLVSLKLS
jgi:hypothetical protein